MRSQHVWALGFRPFYLLASVFAALSVGTWVLQYAGLAPSSPIRGPVWHGHEMLFGFAMAVIAGFLFTAVRNWTGRPTPSGPTLAAIALLWIAGRVLVLTPWALAAAIVNALFPLAIAVGIGGFQAQLAPQTGGWWHGVTGSLSPAYAITGLAAGTLVWLLGGVARVDAFGWMSLAFLPFITALTGFGAPFLLFSRFTVILGFAVLRPMLVRHHVGFSAGNGRTIESVDTAKGVVDGAATTIRFTHGGRRCLTGSRPVGNPKWCGAHRRGHA